MLSNHIQKAIGMLKIIQATENEVVCTIRSKIPYCTEVSQQRLNIVLKIKVV